MRSRKSLKSGILLLLVIPMILFILLESLLSYFVTLHYVDQTYDRWLLDSARSLVQEIKVRHAKVLVELPSPALEIVRWDDVDETYFKITSAGKGLLRGDAFVPEPANPADWSKPLFFKSRIGSQPVRVVSLRVKRLDIDDTFYVHVAETLKKRNTMMTDILLADLIPQTLMVVFTVVFLLIGLNKSLKPLAVLNREIAKRSPRDLSPIAETYVLVEASTLTDTINTLLKKLSDAIAGQQRFIANAAHQLRTPLAGFVIQAERAAREDNINDMRPALYQMQHSAHRLSHTVNQLLVLAKSERIDNMGGFTAVDLGALARAVCIEHIAKALQRRMELNFEGPAEAISVRGDEHLLRELLANLLNNAIIYGNDRGHITVSLTGGRTPGLAVEDDGPGIPETETAKVFDRFYRIPGSRGEGCGLGLALVKEIAELHKARLELVSNRNRKGTQIAIRFPAAG